MDIVVYDTTLRDGMQGEGMSLSVEEKVRVARILDELGVPMIEAGFPTSNPKELELFERLQHAGLTAAVCAFGMTRRRGVAAEEDAALRVLAESWTPVSTIVGKTWGLHLEKVVKVDRDENLRMIAESVAFLVANGKRVVYDAEHFFDGYADDAAYAIECLRAAFEAGAENLTMCDTNGASLPHDVAAAVRAVRTALPQAALGIHTHNDAEVAVANSLAAIAEGATMVQGTMNGYGERCGNANLISIIPNLQLKMGKTCLPSLEGLTEATHLVAEMLNLPPDANQAYVGKNAFAHKGGMHVAGVNADPSTFEHIDPAEVGNSREVLVSELSGKGTVIAHAGGALDDATAVARGRARQGARAPRLPVRGRRRLLRAADQARDGGVRAAVQARVLARDRREARRRARRDRGHGQGLGRQPALRQDRGGQRPRPRARTARCAPPSASTSRTCATSSSSTSRFVSSTNGKRRARRRACCWTPRDGTSTWGAIGVHENVIEASLGRAGRFARGGDAAQPGAVTS